MLVTLHFLCQNREMNIVFYDGDCGLCQRSVRFIMKADLKKKLFFAPLNGETFMSIYGERLNELSTVLFYTENKTFKKSDAVFEIAKILGGIYRFILLFKLIPRALRDFVYEQIAKRRSSVSCIFISRDDRFLK